MIGYVVAGLGIGVLACLVRPSRQHVSWFATLQLGVAGALVGGLLSRYVFGHGYGTGSYLVGFAFCSIAAVFVIGAAEARSSLSQSADRPR